MLDELGYVPFQKQGAELLFHIIADCYEQKKCDSYFEFRIWSMESYIW
ncbi:ATP-binding protein [Bacillus cereus]